MSTGQNIIDAVRRLISDETAAAISGYRWTDAELLTWITEAQRAVVELKPEAYPLSSVHDVDATNPRQRVAQTLAYKLIRVEANSNSTVATTPITLVERDVLDTFVPTWMTAPAVAPTAYQNYVLDDNDPLAFWLFPRATNAVDVLITYAGIPAAVAAVGNSLSLGVMYDDAVTDYVVYRALSKDARGAASGVADKYRDKFLLALGATRQVMKMIGQNTNRPPDAGA